MDNPWKILSTLAFLDFLDHKKKEEANRYKIYDDEYLDENYENNNPYDNDFEDEIDNMLDEKLNDSGIENYDSFNDTNNFDL